MAYPSGADALAISARCISGPGPYISPSAAVSPRASSGVISCKGLVPLSASWVSNAVVASSNAMGPPSAGTPIGSAAGSAVMWTTN
jgi:hypothetical protein